MEEKSNSSQKKDEMSTEKQMENSTQKITNFFPILRTEGRAKMCGVKSDDSKQKEMLKKIKGKESMTLRSKRQDKLNEKASGNEAQSSSQTKEKIRNISVAAALKTPLSQVLRKNMEASDSKKETVGKPNSAKSSDSSGKATDITKRNLSDSEGGRVLRQKTPLPHKPPRAYKRRTVVQQTSTGNDKPKASSGNSSDGVPHRGRPTQKIATSAIDSLIEGAKSDNAVNANSGPKQRKYRKRHFRGSTYGLYLTPAKKKKKKLKSSPDESKDEDGSVTSTENNSFLDSEDANSLVSEDFFTPSEKSLVDEEHTHETQSSLKQSSDLSDDKKLETHASNNSVESDIQNTTEQTSKTIESEEKIEITADYEENTQNAADLFQELEEMQWEPVPKPIDEADATNNSQTIKAPQYDDISSESFSNALHFSFKKNSPKDTEDNGVKDDLPLSEKCEEPTEVDSSNIDDAASKETEKMVLPETPETCLSLHDNMSEMFDMKDDSNIASSEISEGKEDLNLLTSDIKEDLNLVSTDDMLVNKENLNLVLSDVPQNKEDSNILPPKTTENKDLNIDSANMPEDKNFSIETLDTFEESKTDSNLMQSDIAENKDDSGFPSCDTPESKESKRSPYSLVLTDENKQDSNSVPFTNENKQDSNSVPFTNENKQNSDSLPFTDENKQNSDSFIFPIENNNSSLFTNEKKQPSDSFIFPIESKQVFNSPLFTNEEKQNSDSFIFPIEKQESNIPFFTNEKKQESGSFMFTTEKKQDSNSLVFPSEKQHDSNSIVFSNEKQQDSNSSIVFSNEKQQDSNSFIFPTEKKQISNSLIFSNEKKLDSDSFIFPAEEKQDSDSFIFPAGKKQESNAFMFSTGKKQDSNFTFSNEKQQETNSFTFSNEKRQDSNFIFSSEKRQESDCLVFPNESKQDSNCLVFPVESKQDSNCLVFTNENKQESNCLVFPSENKQDSNCLIFPNENKQDSNCLVFPNENKQDSDCLVFPSENKQDSDCLVFPSENKQDSNCLVFPSENKQDSNSLVFPAENKQESNSLVFPVENKQESNSLVFPVENKQESNSLIFPAENKQDSNSVAFPSENKRTSNSLVFTNENNQDSSPLVFTNEIQNDFNSPSFTSGNKHDSLSISFANENQNDFNSPSFTNENKHDSLSISFTNENKHESVSLPFVSENKHDSISLSFPDENKHDSFSLSIANENKNDADHLSFTTDIKNDPDPVTFSGKESEVMHATVGDEVMNTVDDEALNIVGENKDQEDSFKSHMEVDNSDKQDDDDGQSTIANCVKSRQRIKRRFTDDIVDTDLGILSMAAMASVKKALAKQENKDVIENFSSVTTHNEAKKGSSMAKIECVFNYKQAPIKSCTCESDSYETNLTKNEDAAFCQAVDCIDDKLLGCSNPVVTSRLVRASVKIPFTIMCETHLWRLKHHHSCPYCGLFCSQGTFIRCSADNCPHFYHEQCQSKEDGQSLFCLHCGSKALQRVHLEMHMTTPPNFFLSQSSNVSVPDVSKARISFCESPDFCRKDEDEPIQMYKIEDSGKILSSAGLPDGSYKEELEKLISALSDDKVRSCIVASDEFYDMAASGNVLKVLFMLAKGLDPNYKFTNHEGDTALHAAAAGGHITVVHLLIQAGAVNDSLNEKMYTPLMLAAENGHKDVVHYLVKKGALTDFKGENGMSSLHLAAKSGNLEILRILMTSRDSHIDAQDDGGWTPIVWASEHDHLNVVRYLLKRGANPNIRDNEGNIGLHWSAFSGSVEISYLYLDYGCDINAVNELGDTPLHIAARQDSYPCVTLFLSRGADVTIMNKANKLPAECCIDKNSDTYLSLSLNMLLKKITGKYQHKAEKIIHRDISRGKEQLAIQAVNAVDDEMPPLDFLYVTENCETMPIKIDRTITSLQACHCEDDCSTASCSCASISYQCWYDKEGLLLPEFNLLDPPMLFECNRACSCWSLNCHNRVLQNGITSRLQLIRTKGKGWGVRTLKDIPKGAFICEYVGELISDSAADKRSDDSYLFDLDNRDGETYCLDARYYGNISRFINHLCEPNLVPVKVYVDHQDLNFPRIAFFSSRDIKQYEELGFDYGEKFWAIKYKFFTCECGSPKCKYSKESIHVTLANYYRRLKEEQMEEAAATQQPVAATE